MTDKICWIKTVDYEEAGRELRAVYDNCRGPSGQIDKLYKAYSLMPHAMGPADDLYRAVLHNDANLLPKWLSELIGTYVAILDDCSYARANHGQNYLSLCDDPKKGRELLDALDNRKSSVATDGSTAAVLKFVEGLSQTPAGMGEGDVGGLRDAGFSDGEILEIVQVTASFCYFTRVINGLGIATAGEKVGYYS